MHVAMLPLSAFWGGAEQGGICWAVQQGSFLFVCSVLGCPLRCYRASN